MPRPTPKKSSPPRRSAATLWLSLLFCTVAVATVVLLDYFDFRHGRDSVLFGQLLHRHRSAPSPKEDMIHLLRQQLEPWGGSRGSFLDSRGVWHLKADVPARELPALAASLSRIVRNRGGQWEWVESQKINAHELTLHRVTRGGKETVLILLNGWSPTETEEPSAGPRPPAPVSAPAPRVAPALPPGKALVAIIIDDIGFREGGADDLIALGMPVTGAVIPSAPYAGEEASRLSSARLESLIHVPMQALKVTSHTPREDIILADSRDDEIRALFRRGKSVVPAALGFNNHMGSLVTSRRPLMERVLHLALQEGLFFVDSKTSGDTVGFSVARELGMRALIRDVFLDDDPTYDHTAKQIHALISVARQNGQAVAIGHPFASTFRALTDARPLFSAAGITLVPISALLPAP